MYYIRREFDTDFDNYVTDMTKRTETENLLFNLLRRSIQINDQVIINLPLLC